MTPSEYLALHATSITQPSEKLFVEDFLYPVLGDSLEKIEPQKVFLDRSGRGRRIDFAYRDNQTKIALEVNGETYHAEGIIPDEAFDDNLYRQNEILRSGYALIRFSYSQLQSPAWRLRVMDSLREFFSINAPELLEHYELKPNVVQIDALANLAFYRDQRSWKRAVVIMPMGTGKTILSALDALRVGGRVLFIVHRLDILKQSIDAYTRAHPTWKIGMLTGEERYDVNTCDALFASKDTLRQPDVLSSFAPDAFNYVVIDEVHHGQTPTYRQIITYFRPRFMLGITGTPDRADRQDIFELFDYQKAFEITLSEAIERGFLVPYKYIGMTDDVDYSRIRFQNNSYRVDDLERLLIVPKRNEAILRAYKDDEGGAGNKAVGFCVSIKHAERMAELFSSDGIEAAALHSQSPDRAEIMQRFRDDLIQVVFTVDLFNEGVDIPNLRTLLFLRPTESKSVFLQQLGRGLRLCPGKDRTVILDFIGNYRRANQIRKYLAKSVNEASENDNGRTRKKLEYTFASGCEVTFTAEVEEILNEQDADDIEVTQQDLKEAYFVLAEKLGRKPSKMDLDRDGEFKSAVYILKYSGWTKFLQDIGEYTESSYHFPQGVHIGHLLSILKYFGQGARENTHFADEYIKLRGGLGEGRVAAYRRQVKYKLQAAMELGVLTDDRAYPSEGEGEGNPFLLTPRGRELYNALQDKLSANDLRFRDGDNGVPSTRMAQNDEYYVELLRTSVESDNRVRAAVYETLLSMPAVQQMLVYMYRVVRTSPLRKSEIYEQFFASPFVRQFCEQEGIEPPTVEAARHRLPFILGLVEALGVVQNSRSETQVRKMLLTPDVLADDSRADRAVLQARLVAIKDAWPDRADRIAGEVLVTSRELFGPTFLTNAYYLSVLEVEGANG